MTQNSCLTNIISQINSKSGTTIAHGRKRAFKFSGSSVRPEIMNETQTSKLLSIHNNIH